MNEIKGKQTPSFATQSVASVLPADSTIPICEKWLKVLKNRAEAFTKPDSAMMPGDIKQEMEAQLLIVQLVERLSSATKG